MSKFHRRGRARSRPYPFDAVLDGLRVMLLYQDDKQTQKLISTKPADQSNVVPTDYGEDARSPLHGKNFTWDTLHLGLGQRTEPRGGQPSGRYRHSIAQDNSVADRVGMPGPDISTYAPGTKDAQPVNRFFDLGGSLYWLNGRYLMRRDSDSANTAVQDFGAAKVAKDVVVWAPNGLSTTWAYIAMGDADNIWRYDGATATQHASLKATALCSRGTDLHRALNTNQVSTVDINSDPWTAGNWAAPNQYYIGDKSSAITRLASHSQGASGPGGSDFLVVFKTDGIYSLNVAGEDQQYFPFMKFDKRADNGEAFGAFLNDLYVRMGETLWKLTPDMQGEPAGPERLGILDPLLQGAITAFAGHGSFHAYAGLYNHVDDASYLLKFGAHSTTEDGKPERVEAWHGSVSLPFDGVRITALHKTSIGAPANHNRLYLGFSDGTIGWFTLPCVPDPAACDQYLFTTTTEGYTQLPDWHAGFRGNDKLIISATVGGEQFAAGKVARLEYAADQEATYHDLGADFDTVPRETVRFPDDIAPTIASFRLRTMTDDNTTAPLVTTLSIRWRLQTDLQQVYSLLVAAEDSLVSRDGTALRYGAKRIQEKCHDLLSSPRAYECVLPDGVTRRMSFIDIGEAIGYDARFGRWRDAISLTAIEEEITSTYGTYGRLDSLTYSDLDSLSYADLETL